MIIPPVFSAWTLAGAGTTAAPRASRRMFSVGISVPPEIALTVIVCAGAGFLLWWIRERWLAEQRRGVRELYSLSQAILSARSPAEIARQLSATLPRISRVSGIRLYVFNRRTNALELQTPSPEAKPVSLPVDGEKGAPLCFRNRTLFAISDTRRSPLYKRSESSPTSVMLVPVHTEDEVLGVLEIEYADGIRRFSVDQRAAAQHLGNQIAISLKLLEQQSIREQLFRSEKLAAAGQLVSGVVNELEAPLDSIASRAARLKACCETGPWKDDLEAIAAEAKRAAEIVSRLVSFSGKGETQAGRVELNELVTGLTRFRAREWEMQGVRFTQRLSPDPLYVLASRAQLEQVFLTLLVHAEQSMADLEVKHLTVATGVLGQRTLVEVAYPAPCSGPPAGDPFRDHASGEAGGLGLSVCRGIIQSHGGDIRFTREGKDQCRFEVELPPAPAAAPAMAARRRVAGKPKRPLTLLLVEEEQSLRRRLTALLSGRGHRVVPVANGEQAVDLTQRLRFDAVFCAASVPGANWVELRERMLSRTGAFVLVSKGMEGTLPADHPGEDTAVLRVPVREDELDRLMSSLESRPESPPNARAGQPQAG